MFILGLPILATTIDGVTFQGIILPEVVEYAKVYFNDPSLTILPLEEEGGAGSSGSHWDKVFLTMEFMNPTIESPGILSEFTLTFLRATGWYDIDAGAAQPYDWGKDDGPNHFKICPEGKEYCDAADVGKNFCSRNHHNKAYCAGLNNFMSGCHMIRPISDVSCLKFIADQNNTSPEEVYGPHSRCFEWRKINDTSERFVQCHVGKVSIFQSLSF